jgi:hypothetical protein
VRYGPISSPLVLTLQHSIDALQAEFRSAVMSSRDLCFSDGPPRQCYLRDNADVKTPKFGRQRLGVDFSKYPELPENRRWGMQAKDIYFQRDPNGELVTVILCTPEEAKTTDDGPQYPAVARCDQTFVTRKANALVSLTYSRRLLKDWFLGRSLCRLRRRQTDATAPGTSGERGRRAPAPRPSETALDPTCRCPPTRLRSSRLGRSSLREPQST